MSTPTVLVSTWSDGVFVLGGDTRSHELGAAAVRGLASDHRGGALAIVDGHTVRRRAGDGTWSTLATVAAELSCGVAVGELIYLGTEDARLLRLDANGTLEPLRGFDATPGRERWYAGQAVVDGRVLGPPLGIRSLTATADGAVLLANVHVGGIARSTDGGATWQPTIDVESDVHEVRAHSTRPELVVAAAAVGLCVSRDAGATWSVEHDGLHGTHSTAVGFAGDAVLLAASESHFSPRGAIYTRALDERDRLVRLGGGFPEWLDGIVDTGCIAAHGAALAILDQGGELYISTDAGRRWSRRASGLAGASAVLLV